MSRKARNKQQPGWSQEGRLHNLRVKGKEKKPCTGEGRSVDIDRQSVRACREKMKESKGVARGKKPSYCKLKGLFHQGQEVLDLERRSDKNAR